MNLSESGVEGVMGVAVRIRIGDWAVNTTNLIKLSQQGKTFNLPFLVSRCCAEGVGQWWPMSHYTPPLLLPPPPPGGWKVLTEVGGGWTDVWLLTALLELTWAPRTPSHQSVSSACPQSLAHAPAQQSMPQLMLCPLLSKLVCTRKDVPFPYLIEGALGNSSQKGSVIDTSGFESGWL